MLEEVEDGAGEPGGGAPVGGFVGVVGFGDEAGAFGADPPVGAGGELVVAVSEGDDAVVSGPVAAVGEDDLVFAVEGIGGDEGDVGALAGVEGEFVGFAGGAAVGEVFW